MGGEDFEIKDEILYFKKGDAYGFFYVKIMDDEAWDPDEYFFIQILDADQGIELIGKDTKARITIMDNDAPEGEDQ